MTTNSNSGVPMKRVVLSALLMAWAWGVIAGSVGLNALIKSNQEKSRFRKVIKPPTVLNIDTSDVFTSGVVLTVVGALIGVVCSFFLLPLFFSRSTSLARRSLLPQSLTLFFLAAWLFATLVPFTLFFARRSAKVTAFVGSVQLPPSAITQTEKALGSTSVYREIGYLRLVAILPWITLLFTIIAASVLFVASRRTAHSESTYSSTNGTATSHTTEKEVTEADEKTLPPATAV